MEMHEWFGPTIERLVDIMRYPDRANEFGSAKVTAVPVRVAMMNLCRWMGEGASAPRIVPTLEGGLILEWLEYWVDLQLEVKSDGAATVTLGGDREFLKKYDSVPETASGLLFENVFATGINLLEILKKEGRPEIPAKKSDGQGAPPTPASAES